MRGQTTDVLVECKIDSGAEKEGNSISSGEDNCVAKEKLLYKYPKCFRGVDLFSGEYHIALKQDAEPVLHPPRRVPESMKDAVKKELKRMIEIDVIEKVDQPTDWVNSVVIKLFGNYLSSNGLEPDPDKIAAIVDMTPPTYAQELQSFLGMVNYLSRYTPDLATTTAPLRDLTKKDIIFVWGPEHQKAFDNVNKAA
ncbi:hypothetical protein NP493_244g02014 [Ridgeia piscesae]|uniref:Reverse transcriptase n=1 Tax=Ridgeia piscesae TaxID=27915 RepID=A0AAD9NZ87_RIDPI|nr:hypothetical protein NP493_244g02014 [Ridgeia piscesae]